VVELAKHSSLREDVREVPFSFPMPSSQMHPNLFGPVSRSLGVVLRCSAYMTPFDGTQVVIFTRLIVDDDYSVEYASMVTNRI